MEAMPVDEALMLDRKRVSRPSAGPKIAWPL
jgi:hypothetical protein